MTDFFLRVFNIRRDELRAALLFFLHNFFLGLGLALMYTAASTLFLERLSTDQLPLVYIFSALVLLISGRIYSGFEHRYSFQQFLPAVLLFIIFITLLFRVQWSFFTGLWFPFLLMILYRLVYLISNLEFWGFSALVFDVRQSKRLFSFISSGDVPAKLLGYLSVSVLVPVIGLQNLLLLSGVSFVVAYFFLRKTIDVNPIVIHHQRELPNRHVKRKVLSVFFENRLITTLAWIAFFAAIAYNLVDYNFLSLVQEKYHTEEALASFLGFFFSAGYAITIIVKVLLTGRFADRMGVTKALVVLPFVLLIFSLVFIFKSPLQSNQFNNLVFIGLMYMAMNVVKTSVNDPLLLVLFQPLPSSLRLRGHTVLKGLFEPAALFILGITLFLSIRIYGNAPFYYFNFPLFLLLLIWISVIFFTKSQYLESLKNAINKRFLSGSDIGTGDRNYLEIMKQNLHSERPSEVLYAISILEKTDREQLKNNVQQLLGRREAPVVKKTIQIINENRWSEFADQVYTLITSENPEIKSAAIKAYCRLDGHAFEKIMPLFAENDEEIEIASVAGLLVSDEPAGKLFAEQKLKTLIISPFTKDHLRAIEIIRAAEAPFLYDALLPLIENNDTEVKSSAIRVAGTIRNENIIPKLIDLLTTPSFRAQAYDSLCLFGNKTARELRNFISNESDPALQLLAIKICVQLESKEATEYILEFAHSENTRIRDKSLSALSALHYHSEKNKISFFNRLLENEFTFAISLVKAPKLNGLTDQILQSLKYELDKSVERIFHILRILYDRETVNRAALALLQSDKEKRANAFEALDTIIPKKIHDKLLLIADGNLYAAKKVSPHVKEASRINSDFLNYIVSNDDDRFTSWTIACAIHLTELNDTTFPFLLKYLSSRNVLLRETALSSLKTLKMNHPELFFSLDTTHSLKLTSFMEDNPQSKLSEMEKVITLKSTRLFADTPENIIAEIAAVMQEIELHEHEVIFKKGDSGNSMYVVFEGNIRIHDGDKTFTVCTKGDFFGELALLDPEPRSASATAITDGLLLKIEEEDVYELMEDRTEVLRSVMRILCGIIRKQNENLTSVA